jgi:hypothetical protein
MHVSGLLLYPVFILMATSLLLLFHLLASYDSEDAKAKKSSALNVGMIVGEVRIQGYHSI